LHQSIEINGAEVMPGDKILMCTTLAGRDSKEYGDPENIRFNRKPRHNAFGFGVHHCVDLHLAQKYNIT